MTDSYLPSLSVRLLADGWRVVQTIPAYDVATGPQHSAAQIAELTARVDELNRRMAENTAALRAISERFGAWRMSEAESISFSLSGNLSTWAGRKDERLSALEARCADMNARLVSIEKAVIHHADVLQSLVIALELENVIRQEKENDSAHE